MSKDFTSLNQTKFKIGHLFRHSRRFDIFLIITGGWALVCERKNEGVEKIGNLIMISWDTKMMKVVNSGKRIRK